MTLAFSQAVSSRSSLWLGRAQIIDTKPVTAQAPNRRRAAVTMQEFAPDELPPRDAGNHPLLQEATQRVLKDFLTRRAVKTIAFYFLEFHDAPSRNWLLRFDNFDDKDKTKSFKDSDAYITRMLTAPEEDCTVVMGHPRGYFKREYKFKITPAKIAHRILAARAQLAEEFSNDLKLIKAENEEINREHVVKIFTTSEKERNAAKTLIFDSDPFSGSTTPLRAANYRKFKNLLTELAIGRALARYRAEEAHYYLWLGEHQHSNPTENGDDFIKGLLTRPAEHRTNPDAVISPVKIATDIMSYRETIAGEWMRQLLDVPEENLTLERNVLEKSFVHTSDKKEDGGRPATP
eukprot:CAMPEP_0198313816 /NCGR_PEP_ID=MMETSP1450-20131203/4709_1 /TAXON_ID=753684 ORGANISM="Madagascaria erythrocladiodes, Strain CCMP3234" /NCGR_SAMPLE_ID=MMETSP1450 /ASSEMBLY_ACC=CAM_ASM_001115 /LENGTH=347 /DNA_ID=CAMNT_0044016837 /DNA_START=86 /DNA_END=1129 /DNA_ORIENTATION=+